jgi:hypothetical protein
MKLGTVLLFIASLLCATALTPTVLNAAQMSTLKQSGGGVSPVDVDWWSKCIAASACPTAEEACNSPTLNCTYCTNGRQSGECSRFAWSSCAESSGPAGYCGSAVSGTCVDEECMSLNGTAPGIKCLFTGCTGS